MKSFDYSRTAISRRWQEGEQDMESALNAWRGAEAT